MLYTLVTQNNLSTAITELQGCKVIGLDTETYGLKVNDKMFSLILCNGVKVFYFNFHDYQDGTVVLDKAEVLRMLTPLFDDATITWPMHNAPFDLHRLFLEDKTIAGTVWCTRAAAVIQYNQHFKYDLASCLDRIGLKKVDEVEKYISKNKLYTWEEVEGKAKRNKLKHFEKVPFDMMFEYACMDAVGTYKLYEYQYKDCAPFMVTESGIAKICARMYKRGIIVDQSYARTAWHKEARNLDNVKDQISKLSGEPFKNSSAYFAKILKAAGEKITYDKKTNNPKIDKKALNKMSSPIAALIKEYRRASKYISTYYSGLIYESKIDGLLHPSLKSMGATTGRFSSPWQQLPKKAVNGTEVRKCLIPRKGYTIAALDFSQQEFRLAADYAGETALIFQISQGGVDVHQTTADMCGLSRDQAKTLNFALLYGVGITELSVMLGVTIAKARQIKDKYFASLRKIKRLLADVERKSKKNGYIKTITGRKLFLPKVPGIDFGYKQPNALIQGGASDMVKIAMVRCQQYIDKHNLDIHILLQVHDEIIFEVALGLENHIEQLKMIMQQSYKPFNGCYMECTSDTSEVSMAKSDLEAA